MKPLNILIATGIYPPDLGGPAEYAKNIETEFRKMGNMVFVKAFGFEKKLPTGLRHIWYLFRLLPIVRKVDLIIALDTFSVALPTVIVAKIFKKKVIIRTGGDFLWESYVERTGEKVLLTRFYETRKSNFNLKEKVVFWLTKFVLHSVSAIVFSTTWQRDIFVPAYKLDKRKNFIIENFYGQKVSFPKKAEQNNTSKIFVSATRPIKFKNNELLKEAFVEAKRFDKYIILDTEPVPHKEFLEKIANSYAVVLPSFGEISPNMILDAISAGTPFIVTRECGIYDRIKDIAIFVDPLNKEDIRDKIIYLANENIYKAQKRAVESFSFTHSWGQICREFLSVYGVILQNKKK